MADIGATIRALLLADTDVSDVVGTRIHSDMIPNSSVLPAISYRVIDTVPNEHLTGAADVFRARIEISANANTRGAANSLGDKIRLALQLQNRGDNDGTYIHEISMISGESYATYLPEKDAETIRFIASQDFYVSYRPST